MIRKTEGMMKWIIVLTLAIAFLASSGRIVSAEDCSLPSANINCAMVNKLRALTQREEINLPTNKNSDLGAKMASEEITPGTHCGGFTPQETMAWVDYGIRWHDQCVRKRSTFECDRAANEAVRRAIKANRESAGILK